MHLERYRGRINQHAPGSNKIYNRKGINGVLLEHHARTFAQIHHMCLLMYQSGAKYSTTVQYLLLVFTVFEVLECPIHGGNELETSNFN
jgi:hypothetical protein